jgi:hypothetical protein
MTPERLAEIRRRWGPDGPVDPLVSLATAQQDYRDVQDLLEAVEAYGRRLANVRTLAKRYTALGAKHVAEAVQAAHNGEELPPEDLLFVGARITKGRRPHSRLCAITPHPHGPDCHAACPTCDAERRIVDAEILDEDERPQFASSVDGPNE